jgi:ferric-dicitrate binding protein FerR (iron transport regulator)
MLQIASGTTTIQSPDGSIVTLTGPAAATLSNRELSLFWGAANIRVASGPMPFRLTLRDGHAGMVSGEFRVIVSAIATEIEVQTGRLSTTPRESSPLTIGPGEKIALKNAAKSPLDASASSVLDVFLLDSENEISPPDSAVGER